MQGRKELPITHSLLYKSPISFTLINSQPRTFSQAKDTMAMEYFKRAKTHTHTHTGIHTVDK